MSPTALFAALALTQPIGTIRVAGNVNVPDETILHYAAVSREEEVPQAFRKLWETGLFEDIRFEKKGSALIVHVEEKPLLATYRIEGERLPNQELVTQLRLRPGQPFGTTERRRVERRAMELLGEGFTVEAHTKALEHHRVELVIEVARLAAVRVREIIFQGNRAIAASELRRVMELAPSDWTTWLTGRDRVSRKKLEADLERIRTLYRSRGYIDARVGPAEPGAIITIPIVEGRLYALAGVTVDAGSLLDEHTVRTWLPPPAPIFDTTRVDAVVQRLRRYYQSRGYPSVQIERSQTVSDGAVHIHLHVDEGPFVRVGFIHFRGNRRHRDRDLRQHLDIDESDRFNQLLVERGAGAITRLETIRAVSPEVDYTARPGRADITYRIGEVDRFEYLVGGGVNGIQGGTGNGQFIAKSLLGRGEVIRLDLGLGNRFQNFAVGYRDPSTLGHRLFFTADFARADLTFPDETSENNLDYGVRIGGPQGRRLQFLAGLRQSDFTLGTGLEDDVPFLTPFLGRRFRTTRATLTLAYEGRDRPVFSTGGLSAAIGVEIVASDVEAAKLRGQATAIVPLSRRRKHLLALSGRAEAVWGYGKTASEGLPRFERLFLGSENDLRGFAIRGVGPRDGAIVVGGDRLVLATVEYQFVLHPRFRLAGFFDAGNVYATDFEGVALPDLRYDAGGEVQILAPVWNVPFRAGYAVNLDPVLDEERGRFFVALAVRF